MNVSALQKINVSTLMYAKVQKYRLLLVGAIVPPVVGWLVLRTSGCWFSWNECCGGSL